MLYFNKDDVCEIQDEVDVSECTVRKFILQKTYFPAFSSPSVAATTCGMPSWVDVTVQRTVRKSTTMHVGVHDWPSYARVHTFPDTFLISISKNRKTLKLQVGAWLR